MKRKGLAHAVILGGLLAFVTLFMTTFLWECFQSPSTAALQQEPKPIAVTTVEETVPLPPTEVETPSVAVDSAPSPPTITPPPATTGVASTLESLYPPDLLLWVPEMPVIEKMALKETLIPPARVPTAPKNLSVTTKLHVPDVPFLFEPMVLSEEEYDMFFPAFEDPQERSDDFFADFFVVGEDSVIAYEDGLYYLGLLINGDYIGDIEVKFEGEKKLVNTSELSLFINDYITKDTSKRLFGDNLPYLSLEQINNRDVAASYDSAAFTVSLGFGLDDMPERAISITASSISRREQYGMSGAIKLEPAKLSIASSLSLYTLLDYAPAPFTLTSRLISLSVSNRLSVLGVGFNISFSLASNALATTFNLGSWSGFYDFVERSERLSFGNVGSSLSNRAAVASSTPFGVQLEKNYSYGTERAKGNQFEHKIVLVEPSEVVISINNTEVFRRTFTQAGTYRLKDFVFTQGANVVKVVTIPTARPDDTTVEYVDMGYDYRLLGKGDSVYGYGLTVPKVKGVTTHSSPLIFDLPWYKDSNNTRQYLSYHLDKFTINYWQQRGVTNTFTLSSDLAFSPGTLNIMLNGVVASMVGTSQLQFSVGVDDRHNWLNNPSLSVSLNHRFSGKADAAFGTLNAGINFQKPYPSLNPLVPDSPASVGGTLSYSGNLTKDVRFTVSGSIAQSFGSSSPSWNASFSSGFSPFTGMSLNGTLSLNALASAPLNPTVTLQISGNYSFSQKVNATVSTSQQSDTRLSSITGSSSLGLSYRPSSKSSFNLNLTGLQFNDPLNHSLVGGWSYSGDLASFSLRQQASNSYKRMTTTFSANTSLAFADGAFAIARSVNEAFFLVRPVGELRGASISIARSLDSSPTPLKTPLGSALYNSITTNTKNTVLVFSSGLTDYSTGASFVYEITPRSRQAFRAKLDIQPSFTVSGVLLKVDQSPYEQYSSPVYLLSTDPEGNEVMTRDDALYLFTDQDGRFILSDVLPGDYLFDLQVDDLWYAVRFSVPQVESGKSGKDRVLLLEDFWVADPTLEQRIIVKDAFTQEVVEEEIDVFGSELVTGYDATLTLEIVERIDEETFWSIIFPPFDEDDWSFDDPIAGENDFFFVEQSSLQPQQDANSQGEFGSETPEVPEERITSVAP